MTEGTGARRPGFSPNVIVGSGRRSPPQLSSPPPRSADVRADISATAFDVPLRDFERFRKQHPRAGERIMRNLAQLLADFRRVML